MKIGSMYWAAVVVTYLVIIALALIGRAVFH